MEHIINSLKASSDIHQEIIESNAQLIEQNERVITQMQEEMQKQKERQQKLNAAFASLGI